MSPSAAPLSLLDPPTLLAAHRAADGARRRTSASAVLRCVLDHGPVARSTIARLTGLSPASVTGHCAHLDALGLIRETAAPRRSAGAGRPHVPVDLDTGRLVVGGVHIAVPYTSVAILDLRGRVIAERRLEHDGDTDPGRVLATAADALGPLLLDEAQGRTPLGVGVAVGGWVDRDSGTVVEHALLGWRDVAVRDTLGKRIALPVQVDGHARALVNAERLFGQARQSRSMLHLFVGNVVDAAFATHNEVHHGPRSQAGAIAHLPLPGSTEPCECGRRGCLQAELSERTLCRRAREQQVIRTANPVHVVRAAAAGNPAAVQLLVERARMVGQAVRLLLDVLNPETVVVTEVGVLHHQDCLDALREEVGRRDALVVPSSFPASVLAMAGGSVALDMLYRDPLSVPTVPTTTPAGPGAATSAKPN